MNFLIRDFNKHRRTKLQLYNFHLNFLREYFVKWMYGVGGIGKEDENDNA